MGLSQGIAIICEDESGRRLEETIMASPVGLPNSAIPEPSSVGGGESLSVQEGHAVDAPGRTQSATQLSSEQRRELLELQQQIQVQLQQQQELAKSIQDLPLATDAACSSAGVGWGGQGPMLGGDAPAADPEPEGEDGGASSVTRIDPEEVAAELPSDVHRAQAPARSLNNGCRHGAVTGAGGRGLWPPVQGPPVELPPLRVDRPLYSSIPEKPRAIGRGGPPGRDERRWIEAAVRRMFRSIGPTALDTITEAFREQKLKAAVEIVQQAAPIATGPGLCVLFEGVIDVLHRPVGTEQREKVCTYDRCGQCFGELELCYDAPRAGASRRRHWATIATRTAVTLWAVEREVLRNHVRSCNPPAAERGVSTECV